MSVFAKSRSIAYSVDCSGRSGRIACQAVRTSVDDNVCHTFVIVVQNETDCDAQALVYVPGVLDFRHRTLLQTVVGPHSDFTTSLELNVTRYAGFLNVHIEISGDDVDLALIVPNARDSASQSLGFPLDARLATHALAASTGLGHATRLQLPTPVAIPHAQRSRSQADSGSPRAPMVRPSPRIPAAGRMFALFLAVTGGVGITVLHPQVAALGVPERAQPATSIPITYRATGIGRAAYEVIGPNAESIAAGSLATGSGVFALTLPRDREDRAYLVRVKLAGPFGNALAEEYVRVPAVLPRTIAVAPPAHVAPPSPGPQIRSLALDRATLTGGETLNVYYDVAASGGTVALMDAASQIAYGKSALSATGHTSFVIPSVDSQRFLTVVVTAQRGAVTTQSRVAVNATPQVSPTPQAGLGKTISEDSVDTMVVAPVIDAPKSVRSGAALPVLIRDAPAGLVLVLKKSDGTEIARRTVATAAPEVRAIFSAPRVKIANSVRLEASYPQGSGSETIVQIVDVRAY